MLLPANAGLRRGYGWVASPGLGGGNWCCFCLRGTFCNVLVTLAILYLPFPHAQLIPRGNTSKNPLDPESCSYQTAQVISVPFPPPCCICLAKLFRGTKAFISPSLKKARYQRQPSWLQEAMISWALCQGGTLGPDLSPFLPYEQIFMTDGGVPFLQEPKDNC